MSCPTKRVECVASIRLHLKLLNQKLISLTKVTSLSQRCLSRHANGVTRTHAADEQLDQHIQLLVELAQPVCSRQLFAKISNKNGYGSELEAP